MSMDALRFKVLRAFGVAPWSEEAKGLTDEMCLEYAAFLDDEGEGQKSAAFDEGAFYEAQVRETSPAVFTETSARITPQKTDFAAISQRLERELRCRDSGFITY